jgi:hypothetical protein
MAKKKKAQRGSTDANGKSAKNTKKSKVTKKTKPSGADSTQKPDKPIVKFRQIPLERVVPDDITSTFANHFVIQHEQAVFHLSFFEIREPIIADDDPAEREKKYRALTSVKAKCVARITIPADKIQGIVEAMKTNIQSHLMKATGQVTQVNADQGEAR